MKKLLACILTLVLSLCCLTACDTSVSFHVHTLGDWEYNEDQHWQPVYCLWGCNVNVVSYDHFDENGDCICDVCPCYVESDISKLSGITREDHENYTVFRFNNFSGKAVLTMDRKGLEAGVIYYTGELSKGAVRVTYDRGPWDSTETLYTFYENVSIPTKNSTVGKIDQDELDFIFEALAPASGEIIISFVPIEHNSMSDDEYSVTMNDEEWLYENLQLTYKAGETVSVKIGIAYDLGYMLFVNGERVMPETHTDAPYWEFIFTIPESDVVIDFKTYDGFLPDFNYAVLIETYWEKIPKAESVSIIHYYGEYESGAIVAMMTCSEYDYTEALWDEIIDDVVIHYSNGNRIIVLYDGEFYNLTEAYNNGYITAEDLVVISEKHKEFCPYLYE